MLISLYNDDALRLIQDNAGFSSMRYCSTVKNTFTIHSTSDESIQITVQEKLCVRVDAHHSLLAPQRSWYFLNSLTVAKLETYRTAV